MHIEKWGIGGGQEEKERQTDRHAPLQELRNLLVRNT